MIQKIKKFSTFLILTSALNACDGEVLFRTKPCEEGTVREGSACVAATKALLGDCKDPDLNNLKKGDLFTLCDGSIDEGKLEICAKDSDKNCLLPSNLLAIDPSKLDAAKIARGTTIVGVSGSMRPLKQCRNYSALATFDTSYPPSNIAWNVFTFLPAAVNVASDQITFSNSHGLITNSLVRFSSTGTLPTPLVPNTSYFVIYVSNTVIQLSTALNGSQLDITDQGTLTHMAHDVPDYSAQYFDTIDDNNDSLTFSPNHNPWSSSEYLCDASNFVNVTSSSAPLLPSGLIPSTGTQPFTQIWQDQITGMYISNILSVSGGKTWSDAIKTCESLNGGTAGDGWRLPTQKELMQLYINGIAKTTLVGGSSDWFWSATSISSLKQLVWVMKLPLGLTDDLNRTNTTFSTLCMR